MDTKYHSQKAEDVLKTLNSSMVGLSTKEAQIRLLHYGQNRFERKRRTGPLKIFINQFKSFLVIILMAAAVISYLLGYVSEKNEHLLDTLMILAIIVINAVLGFFQEYKAERSLEVLEKLSASKARVIRDGRKLKISSLDVVPGDIILLETGDKIPADARLLETINLHTDESPLTGESVTSSKNILPVPENAPVSEQKCMVFMDCVVTQGKASAVVTSTGMHTEIGKIATMIQQAEEKHTPLQEKLDTFGKKIGVAVLIICALVFTFEFLRGAEGFFDAFMTSVSLAVATVPEGLPAIITISLAIGLERMVKSNAIVRKLPAVETLGCVTVICSDKTGTLTKDEMTVQEVFINERTVEVSGVGYEPKGDFSVDSRHLSIIEQKHFDLLVRIGALCNNAELNHENGKWGIFGDPTEGALIVLAEKAGFKHSTLKQNCPRIYEVEFTSERKKMTTLHKTEGKIVAYSKGAPEVLLRSCTYIYKNGKVKLLFEDEKQRILARTQSMAQKALRVLAIAYREIPKSLRKYSPAEVEKDFVFMGLVGMIDPPRPEVKEAIKLCKEAGIKTIMITGDHSNTAEAIAKALGMCDNGLALTGEELDQMSDEELYKIVQKVSVYARVSPTHKVRILDALKKNSEIVAMTGDGINDAPAIKKADIGIAMGMTGTDVAKEASDMVLEDDNFATIVSAVHEGRNIFDNIRKFINYLLTSNAGEIMVIFGAALVGMPLPLIAVQILWINLLTDGLPAVALSVDPSDPEIMKRKPRSPKEEIINKDMKQSIFIISALMCVGTLSLFYFALKSGAGIEKARTIAFATVVLFEMARVQTVRSEYKISAFSNKYLIAAILTSIALLVLVIYVPMLQSMFRTVALTTIEWVDIIFVAATAYVVLWAKNIVCGKLK